MRKILLRKSFFIIYFAIFLCGCTKKDDINPSFTIVSDKNVNNEPDTLVAKSFDSPDEYLFKEKNIISAVHFDFDSSVVDVSFVDDIERAASIIKQNANKSVLLVGNCDHFGDANYNLALGKLRAEATQAILVSNSVDPSKITLASKGSSEADFSVNKKDGYKDRRVDIILQP